MLPLEELEKEGCLGSPTAVLCGARPLAPSPAQPLLAPFIPPKLGIRRAVPPGPSEATLPPERPALQEFPVSD